MPDYAIKKTKAAPERGGLSAEIVVAPTGLEPVTLAFSDLTGWVENEALCLPNRPQQPAGGRNGAHVVAEKWRSATADARLSCFVKDPSAIPPLPSPQGE